MTFVFAQSLRITGALFFTALVLSCGPEPLSRAEYLGGTLPDSGPIQDVDDALSQDTESVPQDTASESDILPSDDVADSTTAIDTTAIDTRTDTGEPDAATTVDVTPSTDLAPTPDACTPDCANKECGDDGCGGICGICSAETECNNINLCVAPCEQQCEGKFCGPDGCGGTCGACDSGFECGPDGKCYDVTCVPNCVGKVCGDDGCNGVCGTCVFGDLCEEGECVEGPCSGIPEGTGTCEDGKVVKCVGGEKITENCTAIPGYTCKWNPNVSEYQCLQTGGCLPNCVTKECGDDGCGGFCGICPSGWPCQTGQCTPVEGAQCGYYNAVGTCEGDTLYYCDSSTLFIEDCSALGKTCGFDPSQQSNQCID